MSWLKVGITVAVAAGAIYGTYKLAKKHPKAVAAVGDALAASAAASARMREREREADVVVVVKEKPAPTVVVVEQETIVVEPEAFEGVMSTSHACKGRGGVTIDIDGGNVIGIRDTKYVPGQKEHMSFDQMARRAQHN